MEQAVIFGAGKSGLKMKRDLAQQYEICCFCDNNERKCDYSLDGIPIISFEKLLNLVKEKRFRGIIIISAEDAEKIVEQIRRNDITLKVYGYTRNYYLNSEMSDILCPIDTRKPRLYYYEYHIAHHCNLKCRGCGHYSNAADVEFGDLKQYINDLARLKELYWGVRMIRLMGGEPLLNKQLPEFIYETRKTFPDADIRIVTNGLLIPKAEYEVFESMRKNSASFDISQYLPTRQRKEEIEMKCMENNIRYEISPLIERFFDITNEKGDTYEIENFEKCVSRKCHFLMDGKISVCALPILYKKYRDKLKLNRELSNSDIIDIYDSEIDGFEMNRLLSKPVDACRYCNNIDVRWFNWQGNYPYL